MLPAKAPEAEKEENKPTSTIVYAHRQLHLDGFEILKDSELKNAISTTVITLLPEPVLFSTASLNENQLAAEVLVHLRRAARAKKDDIYVSGGRNKYYRRLLLRPLLIPGTRAYANAHAIRRQFRQAMARQIAPQLGRPPHQQSQVRWKWHAAPSSSSD